MFNYILPESELRQSWFMGRVANAALVSPVVDARMILLILSADESKAHQLRANLESVFDAWKAEHGTLPDESHGGLLGSPYDGKTIAECPSYVCAGSLIRDYAGLLAKLRSEAFEPLGALDKENGADVVTALLVLSEAADGRVESAVKAHWEIQRHNDAQKRQREEQERQLQGLVYKRILPLVEKAVHFSKGGTHKKGNEYEPKASIRRITEIIGKRSRDSVLRYLKCPENCDAIYKAGGVMFDGIDRKNEVLFYYDSNINPDIKQELKFKRLSNILTEIKE